jgi:uncharacterized RDD family membrane protein YckC
VTSPPPVTRESLQEHYAGAGSRFAAYAVDAGVSTGLFVLGIGAIAFAIDLVTGIGLKWTSGSPGMDVVYAAWLLVYFAYSWAAFGKTIGMALFGVRVVGKAGDAVSNRRAIVRTLALPLSFVIFGLGFAGIVLRHDRRALHDLIAGTAVVYSWDAHSARLRFLARK